MPNAELCDELVSELLGKIDRSGSGSEKAQLRGYLTTARKCAAKTSKVIRDGAALNRLCTVVLDNLLDVEGAEAGSSAARRSGSIRKAASGCVAGFERWQAQVEDLKALHSEAMDIIRAT